jgi:hypothetical protein
MCFFFAVFVFLNRSKCVFSKATHYIRKIKINIYNYEGRRASGPLLSFEKRLFLIFFEILSVITFFKKTALTASDGLHGLI